MIMAFWAPCVNVGRHDVPLFPAIYRKLILGTRCEIGIMWLLVPQGRNVRRMRR